MAFKERISSFYNLIYEDKSELFNLPELRKICFSNGCPDDDKHIRSIVWKILLGYLPINRDEWSKCLQRQRELYKEFVQDLLIENGNIRQSQNDHPLNTDPNSNWKNYFRENEILQQIDKDVRRLYPDISFFQQKISKKFHSSEFDVLDRMNNSAQSVDVIKDCFGMIKMRKNKPFMANDSLKTDCDDEFHWQIVARILFIYAKLNPGQGYVQGMNEIIGPIYYVFANDSKLSWREHSEADTFWCFTNLMSEIRDIFNKHADSDKTSGIVSLMGRFVNILSKEDSELCQKINLIQGIKPHYYAFRWITLLLSQEFPLPDVLRLWDYLFSDENRFDFLLRVCCSMIILIRDQLMSGDFATNMKLLQNFPDTIETRVIVNRAKSIRS
ncbi:TBC1 domain family member 13 [Sarcoptes scabiei]|uniref:TBC1 domain family member 13 n=1 Tax=Sarcoptes scabiei TaxID=52283 RepID=A0A834RF81_SARSC|nr:TBC1 domain family member 13 [Sarcoptes scabiei]